MSLTVIVYNQPQQKFLNHEFEIETPVNVDLTEISLGNSVALGELVKADTFALVFDGVTWVSQTYTEWENLRINEALQTVKTNFSVKTQEILSHFVTSMTIKYEGKKSWVELLNELGQEIER